jgi:hypothetical protein
MLITKIKVQKIGITITYTQPTETGVPDTITVFSEEDARPAFYDALNSLVDDVVNLCLLDLEGWENVAVSGVTLKHKEEMGVVITAQNKVENVNSPVIINTPYFIADANLTKKLEEVSEEAVAFVRGARAQASLFDGNDGKLDEIAKELAEAMS